MKKFIIYIFVLIIFIYQPCLGAVNDIVKTDIRGLVRPQGDGYDIGAYEWIYEIDAPGDLTLTIDDPDSLEVTLDWNESVTTGADGVAGYEIYYDNDSGYPYEGYGAVEGDSGKITVDGNTLSQSVTGLTPGQNYYFAVKAFDQQGIYSGYSNEVSLFESENIKKKIYSSSGGCFVETAAFDAHFKAQNTFNAQKIGAMLLFVSMILLFLRKRRKV